MHPLEMSSQWQLMRDSRFGFETDYGMVIDCSQDQPNYKLILQFGLGCLS